jgi:hypothetical protein
MDMKTAIRMPTVLGVLLVITVLIHGLVIGPLLVLCVTSGGEHLIELFGQDPCHHAAMQRIKGPALLDSGEDAEDPCVDLFLDNPGLSQCGAEAQPLPACTEFCDQATAPADFAALAQPLHGLKPARSPACPPGSNPISGISLRI